MNDRAAAINDDANEQSIKLYDVVLNGLNPRVDNAQAKLSLAKLFKCDLTKIEQILVVDKFVVKKGVSISSGEAYRRAIEQAGALCSLSAQEEEITEIPIDFGSFQTAAVPSDYGATQAADGKATHGAQSALGGAEAQGANQNEVNQPRFCQSCGKAIDVTASFCGACGAKKYSDPSFKNREMGDGKIAEAKPILRQISEYEKISGILWMVLGGLQVISVFGIIAGIWNLYAGYTRIKIAPRILAADSDIPAEFESLTSLIVIGIINLVLGGVIGILFVVFDYIIRDKVLANRALFVGAPQQSH